MQSRAACLSKEFLRTDRSDSLSGHEGKKDPRDAVRACVELPDYVRHAKFRQVNERILDAKLFRAVVSQRSFGTSEKNWTERLKWRHDALRPYIGKKLACVFVRLPGVHYTIEVDPVAGEIVHWEWQVD